MLVELQIPQFAELGKLFKSSAQVELTETETEYMVRCVKHIFPEHIVFQFNCTNTIVEQQLVNVNVLMDFSEMEGFFEECSIELPIVPYNSAGQTYVCVARDAICLGKIPCTLKFTVREIDPSTGEAEDDCNIMDQSFGIF